MFLTAVPDFHTVNYAHHVPANNCQSSSPQRTTGFQGCQTGKCWCYLTEVFTIPLASLLGNVRYGPSPLGSTAHLHQAGQQAHAQEEDKQRQERDYRHVKSGQLVGWNRERQAEGGRWKQ